MNTILNINNKDNWEINTFDDVYKRIIINSDYSRLELRLNNKQINAMIENLKLIKE